MLQQFTFKKPFLLNVLENVNTLFPGIRRAIAIFTEPDENSMAAYEKKAEKEDISSIEPGNLKLDFIKEQTQNKPFSWINESLIIEESNSKPYQLEIEDEYENNILLIRIPVTHDSGKNLLCLFLEEGSGLVQLSKGKMPLSTREKDLVGQLAFNYIRLLARQHQQDTALFHIFNESFQNTDENLKSAEAELKSTRQNYMQSIISYCNYHLQKISEKSNYIFRLSDTAIDKICQFKDKFELLENIITNAASVALNRSYGKEGSNIAIDGSDIVFYSYEQERRELNIAETDRFSKTRDVLDRYEHAATKVLKNNLLLTGKNLGSYCSPAISPAAITDAINKHGRKMLTLFDNNPNKWLTIRSRFKPIINLISNKKGSRIKIAN